MSRKRRNAGMTLDTSDHPVRPFRTPAFRPGSPHLAGALSACVARARQRAGQIKASPAYTTAIQSEPRPSGSGCARNRALPAQPLPHGRGSDRSAAGGDEEDAPKPVLKATVQTDFGVTLKFAMFGHDQLEIQSQRAGETEWTTIGFDTSSPYTDARAPLVAGQPENRRYRARYRDDDNPVGEWSDIIEVTAAA